MAAKKKVSKIVAAECCPAPSGDYKPSMYIDLEGSDVSEIKGLKIGDKVELLVTGVVRGLSQRKSTRYRNGKDVEVTTGSIDLERQSVEVLEDEKKTEFEKLAED